MGVTRYNHTGLCVRDLERSRRFYVELLEFEPVTEFHAEGPPSTMLLRLPEPMTLHAIYLRREGFILELLHYAEGVTEPARERVMNEPGLTHLSFSVDGVAAFVSRVEEFGGEVLSDTDLGGMAVFIRDPDGQLLEILEKGSPIVEEIWGS